MTNIDNIGADAVVLTDIWVEGRDLLVIPRGWAVAELTTWDVLSGAATFGEARADPAAAHLVGEWLEGWLERSRELDDNFAGTGADGEAFNAFTYFGDDNLRVWQPDPLKTTMTYLEQDHLDLAERYWREPTIHAFEEEPALVFAANDRDAIEAELHLRGVEVVRWPTLAAAYCGGPPSDIRQALTVADAL